MRESLGERLRRLLLLVPFVLRRQSVSVPELCERFQISKEQLISDLNLLFLCGLPSYGPGDLIEADIVGDEVIIRTADYFSQPLRLTPAEGLLLYCGARAMAAAGVAGDALERAIERLEQALGANVRNQVDVELEASPEMYALHEAISGKRRVHLVYHSPYKDATTERDVDPWGLFASGGRWYLVGWCHLAQGERVFRVDRIRTARVKSDPAVVPEDLDLSKYEALYIPQDDDIPVTLDLAPSAAGWVSEYYPLDSQEILNSGWVRVRLTAGGTAWLERLLVRLGGEAKVVEPGDLRQRVKDLACALAARYREAPSADAAATGKEQTLKGPGPSGS